VEGRRRFEFRILGPLEVLEDHRPIPLGGTRQRALLAILLTRANEVISTDRLIDDLWGEAPPRTALNTLQYYVSQLRKLLGADRIVTQPPGYVIRIGPDELDLERFEGLVEGGGAEGARDALALWRGPALADFAYEEFAQAEAARLEELRLAALEQRVDADLALGRHAELVGELGQLVAQNPLRERLRGQLMLALHRSGRQAEALDVYQATRRALVEELGIEPSPALQELEKAMLRQDPALDLASATPASERSILVVPRDEGKLTALLMLAEPLARTRPPRELILARLIEGADLSSATALLNESRAALTRRGVGARAAAFVSADAGADVVRLATEQDVELVLIDCTSAEDVIVGDLGTVLAEAPCDVALLVGGAADGPNPGPERPVLVPFGGADHDWAAVEIAAWIAGATGAALRLVGAEGDPGKKRDASRLLASASLLVQRAVGVATEPVLVPRGPEGIVSAAEEGGVIVSGLSGRWRQEGLGETRAAVAREARPPTLFVRRGLRPGGIAPQESLTRFTWSLMSAGRR
jgi:DNA-binding SARP family transcriptional activator